MKMKKQLICLSVVCALLLPGCSADRVNESNRSNENSIEDENSGDNADMQTEYQLSKIDMTKWQYNEEKDVYWQTGIVYCGIPANAAYENLGIYVPAAYMSGKENGDGTFTCEIEPFGTAGDFTAETAPIVIPVDTPGYAAMAAPTGYVSSTSPYTDAGFVYVYAGCRGREAGAPAGVTDLKAAIRYIRYAGDDLPGNTERIFCFGMSGGGAQSALIGATGDSALYAPYLDAIGAVSGVSDGVAGAMCWCPITNLDYASEAYEWNLGVTRSGLSDELQILSDEMAEQFAIYINDLGLTDENGEQLILAASEEGIYQAGSYYDYLKDVIETSLNHFLEDTSFPYTVSSGRRDDLGGPGGFPGKGEGDDLGGPGGFPGKGEGDDLGGPGGFPGKGEGDDLGGPGGFPGKGEGDDLGGPGGFPGKEIGGNPGMDGEAQEERDNIKRNGTSGGISLAGTYETAQDYINALNAESEWVIYDPETNRTVITSIADFVSALKPASKDLGAFDALDRSQGENILFGYGDGEGAHFDAVMAGLLAENTEYGAAYAKDLALTDFQGTSVEERVNMYNPLYYLSGYYTGYQTSDVAAFWRIRTGINQSDTALTTEVNLALALENYGVDVDFETVWGQAHVEAERTGDSTGNLIDWIVACCQE